MTEPSLIEKELPFYVIGGTLPRDALSYVARSADTTLLEGLHQGQFCYVLTSRQMGKSSLMVRTATRLRAEGAAVVVLDLTALGQNLSPDQWYHGLLARVGRELHLEEELEAYWLANPGLGPLQRWMTALAEVALTHITAPIVVFVDEIDVVRSLPFRVDEFFAAIRECHNRRATEPALSRLTFCLLGVATPSSLIADTRITPFNIGRRIELRDFTQDEADTLAAGLQAHGSLARPLLQRVLYWTSGHPYLTQRLCQELQTSRIGESPVISVDRAVERLFLSLGARERDDNLLFVRDRLLQGEADLASLLDTYSRVWSGKPVPDSETNPLIALLHLAGIVRSVGGRLQVRNRIYRRVFDRAWNLTYMPGAELRRQAEAYRKGTLRAIGASTLVLLVMGALSLKAIRSDRLAHDLLQQSEQQRSAMSRLLYVANMNLVQRAYEENNLSRARQLLQISRTGADPKQPIPFEWRYAESLCHAQTQTLAAAAEPIVAIRLSPDGRTLLEGSRDGSIRVWDVATAQEIRRWRGLEGFFLGMAFSPDGKLAALSAAGGVIHLQDTATGKETRTFSIPEREVLTLAFSPDSRTLATGSKGGTLTLLDVTTGKRTVYPAMQGNITALAFSPDSRRLAVSTKPGKLTVWDTASHAIALQLARAKSDISALQFSPDSAALAVGYRDHTLALLQAANGMPLFTGQEAGSIRTLAFSPDGRALAVGCEDATIRLWNLTNRQVKTCQGHEGAITALTFSPDSRRLMSGSEDQTVRVWEVVQSPPPQVLRPWPLNVLGVELSPDGHRVCAKQDDGAASLWDIAAGRIQARLPANKLPILASAYSPNGQRVALGGGGDNIRLWEPNSLNPPRAFVCPNAMAICAVIFTPDGRQVVAADVRNALHWGDAASGQPIRQCKTGLQGISNLACSCEGLLAAGDQKGQIEVWNFAAAQRTRQLNAGEATITSLAFSPDGTILAVGMAPRTIQLWNMKTGGKIAQMEGHRGAIRTMSFSPDGQTLATADDESSIRLWNVAAAHEVWTLTDDWPGVATLRFSADGNTLRAVTKHGEARSWSVTKETER